MRRPARLFGQTYQLVMSEDGHGEAQTIEFEAASPETALHIAQRQCRGREAELMEDGRSLGRVRCDGDGGFWILSGSRAGRASTIPLVAPEGGLITRAQPGGRGARSGH